MSAEAILAHERHMRKLTAAAAVASGEVYQLADGRASVYTGQVAAASGDLIAFKTEGVCKVLKTADEVWLDGDPIYWDHSANTATCLEPIGAGDRDFFLGSAVDDAASAATEGYVNLNVAPSWVIDSARDNFDTTITKTVVGSTTVEVPQIYNRGGMIYMQFGTTAEAQHTDAVSARSVALASNWIADIMFELVTAADSSAVDIDLGMASGTSTTDFEAVTQFAAFHLDGDDLNLDAHSDDGVTDVGPTDTTVDVVAGTPVRLRLDGRDPNNVKYYVEGDEVNSGTANLGDIDGASNALFAIIHAEKTSDDSPLAFKARIRVRTMQVD